MDGVEGVDGVVGVDGVEGVEGVDGVEGVEGVDGVGAGVGCAVILRIRMSVSVPTARAFAGSLGSTVRAVASKPRIV